MELALNILKNTIEYQAWGLNATSVSATMIILFTFTETWGLLKQNGRIWRERSGCSVSTETNIFVFFFTIICGIFSLHIWSISVLFNSLVTGVALVPLVWGLIRFKGLTPRAAILGAGLTLLVIIEILTPYWGFIYTVGAVGFWYAYGSQLWELWKEQKTGVLDIRLLSVLVISGIGWTTYSLTTKNLYFIISQCGNFALTTSIMLLWLWFWKREHKLAYTRRAK